MKSFYQHYEEVLNDPYLKYYSSQMWNKTPDEFLPPDGAKAFIHSIIDAGNKESQEIWRQIEFLSSVRHQHIVSTYLLGLLLYEKNTKINNCVNSQLMHLKIKDHTLRRRFLYIWFLICFFHDLGYAYENRTLEWVHLNKRPTIYKKDKKRNMLPDIYTTKLVRNYQTYRMQCMMVMDHGIYGGISTYDEIFKKLSLRPQIDNILRTISSIIMVHNIFFTCTKSSQAKCYKCHHLDDLVYSGKKCRKILLEHHPLLFLFDLVDSIEPMKTFDGDKSKLQNVEIECSTNLLVKIPLKDEYTKFRNNVNGIDSWLTDVEQLSDDMYQITLL